MAPRYFIDIKHDASGRHRRITGPDRLVVEEKARLQLAAWDQQWQRVLAKDERQEERERAKQDLQDRKEQAAERTKEAREALQALEETLSRTLSIDDRIDWEAMKDRSKFSKPKPQPPTSLPLPTEPTQEEARFQPELSFLDKVVPSRRASKEQAARVAFLATHSAWKKEVARVTQQNTEAQEAFEKATAEWDKEREAFAVEKKTQHEQINARRIAYEAGDPAAILNYCELVLSNSQYPDWITPDFETEYAPQTKTLIVEYALPRFDEVQIPESAATKLYDSLVYQIALRSIHELFEADTLGALEAIAFNGWVQSIDKATGQEVRPCIVSLHTRKEEFLKVNLAQVDPKACFKALKGVGSSKLHSLTPIAPILQMDRTDKRFVDARSVEGTIDEGTNLAAIDWEDFEHLIRELFEKEFTASGGEVKITQASRDGGVDAVAFDPDPIRGGKIVIQAKRYTNTVGVSAVRDLYGTVMNEGATKGILVTTSDYGPDAYSFAKGKPLTLLNGSNLLHLLEKHGHRARIDLQEAKKVAQE
jgi:restriction system protein